MLIGLGLIILKPLHFLGVVFLWLCLKSFQCCIQAIKKMGDSFGLLIIGGTTQKSLVVKVSAKVLNLK